MSRRKVSKGETRLNHALETNPRTAALVALTVELGLTPFQCRFVEALSTDPDRNQRKAAVAAGAPARGADAQASKLLKLAKVQKYLHALTHEEREEAIESAIADLTEVLTVLTAQMRTRPKDFVIPTAAGGFMVDVDAVRNAKPGIIKEISHDEAGDMKIKFVDPHSAAKTLLAHLTDKPLAGGGNITVMAVINGLPPQLATALFRAMAMASGRAPAQLPTLTRTGG